MSLFALPALRRRHGRTFGLVLVGGIVLSSACGGTITDPTPLPPPDPLNSGSLAFSSTATKGWSSITVLVDGKVIGTLTSYVTNTGPSCVAGNGRVAIALLPGTHTYSAQSDGGATWEGSVSVAAGGCVETHLTCANGDCSTVTPPPPPPPATNGSPSFKGSVGFRSSGNAVTLTIEKIVNGSSTKTTGSLRIELWATQAVYEGGTISGRKTASVRTKDISGLSDQLGPNSSFTNISVSVPYTAPPSGYSNYTMVLAQFSSACTSSDNFCIVDYVTLK